jgi:hypothetical protein
MKTNQVLLGIGAALLLVGALAGYIYGVSSAQTRTMPASPDFYDRIASAHANKLLLLDARNISALANEFESNATVEWKGYAHGLQAGHGPTANTDLRGNYTGSQEIKTMLSEFLNNAYYFLVSNETQLISPRENYWVVNSTFHFAGNSSTIGTFEGTIIGQDFYVHVGSMWLIANETWDFTFYQSQVLG